MAVMIPPTLDPSVESLAERNLYRIFEKDLPGEFTVLHQVGILLRTPYKGDRTAEVDFLIVHSDLGLLVLEVKGGQISFNRATDTWFTTNRGGRKNKLGMSPIKQVERTMFLLREKLRDMPRTSQFTYPICRGLAFPDVLLSGSELGSDMPVSLVIDSSNLGNIELAVRRLYGRDEGRKSLSREQRLALINSIKPQREIRQLGLMSEIQGNEITIKELSERQYQLIEFLERHPQVVINGCAGSGKTMLALEKARRLAVQGFDVLLTCYNKRLSGWLRTNVATFGGEIAERIFVEHYHNLAVMLCKEAGRPVDVKTRLSSPAFWEDELPSELDAAIPFIERRFDAIVADEGQDFASTWWITLQELLRDPDGIFYIFMDQQQNIYGRDLGMPFTTAPYMLNHNHRNTVTIHTAMARYYDGDPKPESWGPAGRAPETIDVSEDSFESTLVATIQRLVSEEGLAPSDIVILSPRSRQSSRLGQIGRLGAFPLSWDEIAPANAIQASTIYSFKGLESSVIILIEPEELPGRSHYRELCYVALSRARHHLIVLGALPVDV